MNGASLALAGPSLIALAGYAVAALLPARMSVAHRWALLAGWIAQAAAIVVDIAGIGSDTIGARFGFAPALSVTMWLVLAVYFVESRLVPLPTMRRALAVLGIASYGLFGVAVLHGAMLNRAEQQMRRRVASPAPLGVPLLRLERLTFRFVGAGFVVLCAALLLGAWFANPWRWDHKTVFSILGWLVFALLLAGRRAFGWRGPRATRWLYAGAALLLLAYVGSRFVFEVLLQRPVA